MKLYLEIQNNPTIQGWSLHISMLSHDNNDVLYVFSFAT